MKEIIETNKEQYELIDEIEKVNECLINCVDNLIEIGFRLDEIKNNKSYEIIGYNSFDDFTSIEFKLGSTSVKNYIAVAKKFGDEKSLKLQEKYSKYSLSQLVELLPVSEDIDSYSPALTTKEIRSKKIISQLIDYKKELLNYAINYLKEHEEELNKKYPLIKYKYEVYRDGGSLYIEKMGSYDNLLIINFNDGYYYFHYNERIYDLSLDNFKKIFERKLKIVFSKTNKELFEEKEEKEKRKQEKIDALPENEPGISFEEKIERKEKRLKQEKENDLIAELKKNKDFIFGYQAYYYASEILTFELYMLFNKVNLTSYPLIYVYKHFNTNSRFVGLVNGLNHLRFYNDRIEKYDSYILQFKTILTLDEIKMSLITLLSNFSSLDSSLFNSNVESKKTVYTEDLEHVINALSRKDKEFYDIDFKQN